LTPVVLAYLESIRSNIHVLRLVLVSSLTLTCEEDPAGVDCRMAIVTWHCQVLLESCAAQLYCVSTCFAAALHSLCACIGLSGPVPIVGAGRGCIHSRLRTYGATYSFPWVAPYVLKMNRWLHTSSFPYHFLHSHTKSHNSGGRAHGLLPVPSAFFFQSPSSAVVG
jgi:hypothetical protein